MKSKCFIIDILVGKNDNIPSSNNSPTWSVLELEDQRVSRKPEHNFSTTLLSITGRNVLLKAIDTEEKGGVFDSTRRPDIVYTSRKGHIPFINMDLRASA